MIFNEDDVRHKHSKHRQKGNSPNKDKTEVFIGHFGVLEKKSFFLH